MGKFLGILGLIGAVCASSTAHAQNMDDLFLQTRLDQKSLSWLIDKTRILLANVDIDDKFKDQVTIDDDPTFTMDELSTDSDFVRLRELVGKVFKIDTKDAVIRLRIPRLAYNIAAIHAKPLALNVNDPVLDLRVQAQLKGLAIKLLDGVQADFMIPNPKTKVLESYFTASVEPISLAIPTTLDPMSFEVEFEAIREREFKYALKSYDLSSIPVYVNRNQKSLTIFSGAQQNEVLSANHIRVNPVTIRLNQLTRSISFDAFKPILQKKMPQIVSSVFDLVGNSLKTSIGPSILKTIFSSSTRSDIIVSNSHIYTRYSTVAFSQPDSNQLSLGVQGDLCTAENYNRYHEQCTQYEPKKDVVRTASVLERQNARDELKSVLARGDADVAFSVSEEYINRLLLTTIDAKLWDEMLSEDHLAVGPKGVFVIFNKKTKNPELFLDLLYLGDKGIQKLFVNARNPIRFALRMSTSLSFILKDDVPYLIIKTDKLLSDTREIINGIPEYDLTPKLVPMLKKKIAGMVIKMAGKLEGKNAVEMDIPVFKGLGLEKTFYEVSPYGRLNLYFKI